MSKKMKNKNNLITAVIFSYIFAVFILLGPVGCRSLGNRVEVKISLKDPGVIDFEKYDKILYKDLTLEAMPKDYSPEEELKIFFLDELPKEIGRKIKHWTPGKENGKGEMPPGSLLITGTLKLDVKERSKIKEVKNNDGKKGKKKAFVTVQHWKMTLTAVLKNTTTGQELFKEDFTARVSDAEVGPDSSKFNFENLFFKIANRLVKKLTSTKKEQRRYLLL